MSHFAMRNRLRRTLRASCYKKTLPGYYYANDMNEIIYLNHSHYDMIEYGQNKTTHLLFSKYVYWMNKNLYIVSALFIPVQMSCYINIINYIIIHNNRQNAQ